MYSRSHLRVAGVVILLLCIAAPSSHAIQCGTDDSTFTVSLPWLQDTLLVDSIVVPNNRPIYALIMYGYSQGSNYDGLLCYNFVRHITKKGAYVHYAWWNNLLAPYMARPLHSAAAQPGNLATEIGGFIPLPWIDGSFGGKADPEEDYQFQADAKRFLRAIRDNNPDAIIIVIGHSMGGASAVRLAYSADVAIDIVAPIDPVQNRSTPVGRGLTREYNWTRWRIAHDDFKGYKQMTCTEPYWLACNECSPVGTTWYGFNTLPWPHSLDWRCGWGPYVHVPTQTRFGSHVINLLHRYQKEFVFPFDYLEDWPFAHDVPPGGSSSQTAMTMCWIGKNSAGLDCNLVDGHGEIAGYWGVPPNAYDGVSGQLWPARTDSTTRRILLDSIGMAPDNWAHAPTNPDLCMISPLLIALFDRMNKPPQADAGPDQYVLGTEAAGAMVTLDGSGTFDSDTDLVEYTWYGPGVEESGQIVTVPMAMGTHEFTLMVFDSAGHMDCDQVLVTVDDEIVRPTAEWISIYCAEPVFDNAPLLPGDIIKAYDPTGVLCGMCRVKPDGSYGFLEIHRDDEDTEVDEGAEPGDHISFKVNETMAAADMDVVWTHNGDRSEVCNFGTSESLRLALRQGLNLVSWNLDTPVDDIEEVMAGIMDNALVIRSFESEGLSYYPALPDFATLDRVDHFHGYWIRMMEPDTLVIDGSWVPAATPIALEEGWNLVSYLPQDPYDPEFALETILTPLQVALGWYQGQPQTFDPDLADFSTMDFMWPLHGYWLKVSEALDLVYQGISGVPGYSLPLSNRIAAVRPAALVTSRVWVDMYSHRLVVDGQVAPEGTRIEARSKGGGLIGAGAVRADGAFGFIPVYGDDPVTEAVEGPLQDGSFDLFVNGRKCKEQCIWDEQARVLEIESVTTQSKSGLLPTEFALGQNFPNPFNPVTTIELALPMASDWTIEIFNIIGQRVERFEGHDDAGYVRVVWDATDQPSGVYLYRARAGAFSDTKRMAVIK